MSQKLAFEMDLQGAVDGAQRCEALHSKNGTEAGRYDAVRYGDPDRGSGTREFTRVCAKPDKRFFLTFVRGFEDLHEEGLQWSPIR